MRFLKFCFVLMVVGSSLHAQEKDTCFYHVSFYKWEWNCCYGRDTFRTHDSGGIRIRDTVVIDTGSHPHSFDFEMKDSASFDSAHFEVTTYDRKTEFEIKGFHTLVIPTDGEYFENDYEGKYLPKFSTFNRFHNILKFGLIMIRIKIFDPNQDKEILLPWITIILDELN